MFFNQEQLNFYFLEFFVFMPQMPPEIAQLEKHVDNITEVKVNDMLTVSTGTYGGKTGVSYDYGT